MIVNYFFCTENEKCSPKTWFDKITWFILFDYFCPPLSRKLLGNIKSHSSVRPSLRPSLCLSVTKTLTLAITFALLQVELWYLACAFFVTRPFRWWHWPWPLTYFKVKFVAERGDHNSMNLLVPIWNQDAPVRWQKINLLINAKWIETKLKYISTYLSL